MILPDIAGPTDIDCQTYTSGFTGTSCSTPSTAGAAGAFWSSQTGMTGEQVVDLFFEMADLFKDWGTTGKDNEYGEGGAIAPRNHSTIVLLNRSLNNTGASAWLPYYYVSDAYNFVNAGGRMIFLGGTYPEDPITFNKELDVDNYGSTATVGGP
jgi:subtilisin family serine protease